jgi:hypothetical protein
MATEMENSGVVPAGAVDAETPLSPIPARVRPDPTVVPQPSPQEPVAAPVEVPVVEQPTTPRPSASDALGPVPNVRPLGPVAATTDVATSVE